jgi:uncharacterized protein YcfL
MKKIITVSAFTLLAAAGLFLAGCASHDHGAYIPVATTINDVENNEMVVLLDPRVQYSVTCPNIQQRPLPDGRMEVTANIRNRENRRIEVQINCVFKNDAGFPTEGDESPFRTLILSENGQEPVHFISINNEARRYTIRIREAH